VTPFSHTPFRPLSELVVSAVVERLRRGTLTVASVNGTERVFSGSEPGPDARIELHTSAATRRLITHGANGLAEGYLAGDWDTPDLDAVLDLGVANLFSKPQGTPAALNSVQRLMHAMRDNTPGGSKRNIAYHYDLGNEFYRLWLDETMTYSSALFAETPAAGTGSPSAAGISSGGNLAASPVSTDTLAPAEDLSAAQVRKWDRLLDLLQPTSRDHLLEIGCGWGGFAIHAARTAGCRVTGVTLSEEQHAWATAAVEEAGLEDRVDLRLQDYRSIPETFSGIASIEMFEAVGERWWPVFFGRLKELLTPGGAVALQTITIEDSRFDDYRRHPDFIQRHVFPGGMVPSPQRFEAVAAESGLRVSEPLFFGDSYAETLIEWRQRFEAALPQIRALGFDERFVRLWRYYLSYCRAGFSAGTCDVMQVRIES
jgi:cyclopropane-fatty-acyl-phospholipid synthase